MRRLVKIVIVNLSGDREIGIVTINGDHIKK